MLLAAARVEWRVGRGLQPRARSILWAAAAGLRVLGRCKADAVREQPPAGHALFPRQQPGNVCRAVRCANSLAAVIVLLCCACWRFFIRATVVPRPPGAFVRRAGCQVRAVDPSAALGPIHCS